ncbi:MAG: NUDIX domain-containing protein [Thermoplasmata archaeon]
MGRSGRRGTGKSTPLVETLSAGGVVFRPSGKVLLLRKGNERRWCLPKGGVEEGEGPEDAARREIREETGLYCTLVGHVLDIRYQYYWPADSVSYDKTVKYYLAEVVGGSVKLEPIFDGYRWCSKKEALRLLHYENDKRVVRRAFRSLDRIRES